METKDKIFMLYATIHSPVGQFEGRVLRAGCSQNQCEMKRSELETYGFDSMILFRLDGAEILIRDTIAKNSIIVYEILEMS